MAPRANKRKQPLESQLSYTDSPRRRKRSRVVRSESDSPPASPAPRKVEAEPAEEAQDQNEAATEEPYWLAIEILQENQTKFLIRWEGTDPTTGLPYEPTWEPKRNANEELRAAWAAEKKKRRASTDTPNGTPKKRRVARASKGLEREGSVSSTRTTESTRTSARKRPSLA